MVHAPEASSPGEGATGSPGASGAEFAITLKGWRSQLRWAMTQREEDPARVWLEVISIDERSKRALDVATSEQRGELEKLRGKLEETIASLTEELGDEKVAPLYSWLDLVRQRRHLVAKIEEARAAVAQARALRLPDGSKPPRTEEQAAEQLAQAQGVLAQWKTAIPPAPPPELVAVWDAQGGDALIERMPREAMAVGRRGDEARRVLERAKGRPPGKHPWHGSRAELLSILLAGAMTLFCGLSAVSSSGAPPWAAWLAASSSCSLAALLAFSLRARRQERAELAAAIDWVWHARMYRERTSYAELEAGWLRALVEAQRKLRSFDTKGATGGQLRAFEGERPDLAEIVHEVARDTEPLSS